MAARGVIPNQQRRAPFEGNVSWDTYRTQFELLSQMNQWSEAFHSCASVYVLKGETGRVS